MQRAVVVVGPGTSTISTQQHEARVTQVDICTANQHLNICL